MGKLVAWKLAFLREEERENEESGRREREGEEDMEVGREVRYLIT